MLDTHDSKRSRFRRLQVLAGAVAATSLLAGAAATPATAATFTLTLTSPSTATVGQPFGMTASGTDPTDQGALYLEIDSIPTSVATTCPDGYLNGSQEASGAGGDLVAFDQPEDFDASGAFSNQEAYTRKAAGQLLLCAYTDDGAGDTLAVASALVNVQAAGSGGGGTGGGGTGGGPTPTPTARPRDTSRPHLARHGAKLTCGRGRWSGSPSTWSYAWLVGGRVRRGADRSTLAVTHALRGHTVQCRVTARNQSGAASALSQKLVIR